MPTDSAPKWPAMSIEQANALLAAPGSPLELADAQINGVQMKIYAQAPQSIRAILETSAAAFAQRDYLVYQDERVTFSALHKAVAHMAKVLSETYGVKKGERVAIIMRNYPQWPVAFLAAVSLGAIATPMNSWWTGEELQYGLSFAGVKVAIMDGQIYQRVAPHLGELPELEAIILARHEGDLPPAGNTAAMETFIGKTKDWDALDQLGLPDTPLGPDDEATLFYTSGTTGKPKGALATHRAVISNMFNSLTCQARMFLRRGEPVPEPDPNEQNVMLLAIPMFHVTGAFAVTLPALMRGMKIITMYKWDVEKALPIIEREKVNAVGGVPAIAWQILEHPDREKYDLSSITTISYGGAPSAPELVATIKKRFPETAAGNGWGMTETCATATLNIGEDYVHRPNSAGAAPGAVELKVVGADGRAMPPGEIGELWCKGPMNCKLYWKNPKATSETFIDGWVVTGDIARIDEEGFLYLEDRAKDMLIRGGENIYSIEVENALYDHPAVMDAAIIGIPHKVLGEEVGAVVQVKPGMSVTEDELRAHVAGQLAAFKVPVEIHIQTDPLPRNANGKILKSELREQFTSRG